MKTKNVKVRVKDVKAGKTIYVAHPVYGIQKHIIKSKPYMQKSLFGGNIGLFVKTLWVYGGKSWESEESLRDAGITEGNSYNGRRSFFKLKQAEEWCEKWKTDPSFIAQHKHHKESMKAFNTMETFYDGYNFI